MGSGNESTVGGGEMSGEVGREDWRFINRRLEIFFSLGAPNGSRPAIVDWWCAESREPDCRGSSLGCREPEELTLPTRCRSEVRGTLRCANMDVSIVRVRGLREPLVCRKCRGGLESLLSYDSLKTSLKMMPCRREEDPPGMERGELC